MATNQKKTKTFEDLDLSKDEVKRLGEALKDEKFRKMLCEYAEEISDPENRRKAEQEIAMMEQERGMNVQFIHPEPGYVIKTTVNGTTKAFINVCQNDKIDKPNARRETGPDGKSGLMWQIPHSFAPPREDRDKNKLKCEVYDVVFHHDTYRMAIKNNRFKKLVEDTALDGVQAQFNVTIDKKNIKYPKMKFKGLPQPTIIREKMSDKNENKKEDDVLDHMAYPYGDKSSSEKAKENIEAYKKRQAACKTNVNKDSNEKEKSTVPKYSIIHRSDLDLSEYRNAPDAKTSTRPKELVIKIELPLLKSAAQASLEIFQQKLVLESVSPACYKLDLNLPFPVDEDHGAAKFDKFKRNLTVTLPVRPEIKPDLPFSSKPQTEVSTNSDVSAASELKSTCPSPLIEVLQESNSNKQEDIPENDKDDTNVKTDESSKKELHSSKVFPKDVKFIFPEYQFSQDNDTVSFVLQVRNVEQSSVNLQFSHPSKVYLKFMSQGSGCFPVFYSVYIEFSEACVVSSDHTSLDVSHENLVLLVLKGKESRGLWDCFKIGVDEDSVEDRQFLTESNLEKEILSLEAEMPGKEETLPALSVVEMTDQKLTIDIKPKKNKKIRKYREKKDRGEEADLEDEGDYDETLSPVDIKVIHRRPAPPLHSILKQRTVSESSEDHSHPGDLDSPRSCPEDELSGSFKRRSVSFNSREDRLSFKPGQSVSSMGPSLKGKRKRERRWERKNRSRHNSGGSSSEERSKKESLSDSHSYSEEESDAHSKPTISRAYSDPGPELTGFENKEKPLDIIDERSSGDSVSISGNNASTQFRTNTLQSEVITKEKDNSEAVSDQILNAKAKAATDKSQKIVSEIKSKLSQSVCDMKDSDDDEDDRKAALVNSESQTEVGLDKTLLNTTRKATSMEGSGTKSIEGKQIVEIKSEGAKDTVSKTIEGTKSNEDESVERTETVESCSNHEKSDVDTVLSWEDPPPSSTHATKSAVVLENSLVYDLDVD